MWIWLSFCLQMRWIHFNLLLFSANSFNRYIVILLQFIHDNSTIWCRLQDILCTSMYVVVLTIMLLHIAFWHQNNNQCNKEKNDLAVTELLKCLQEIEQINWWIIARSWYAMEYLDQMINSDQHSVTMCGKLIFLHDHLLIKQSINEIVPIADD